MAWKIRNGHSERPMAEINITPLTDVMLVLLVIFMVTAPLIITESFKVSLPKAVSSGAEKGKGAVISISADGDVDLNGAQVSMNGIEALLKREFERTGDKNVIIKADGMSFHNVVVRALDAARLAGAERLSIATEKGELPATGNNPAHK
ncbi:MAG: biopolymer transporter ExbD [Deltaproteobacteria bacterium]|nr:biopolymer transporter ExbD [Deltaproteobacteria bacterium]